MCHASQLCRRGSDVWPDNDASVPSLSCPRLLLILSPLNIFLTQNISLLCSSVRRVSAACDGDGLTVTNVCHYLVNYF